MTQAISNPVSSKIDTSVMGTSGTVALVSALAVTVIILQYPSYNAAFTAQALPILGCMTLGGPALAVFCITSAIKMREKNPPELLLGIKKERDEAPKLVGLLIDELLEQFPQYKEAIKLEEEFEEIRGVVSYQSLRLNMAFKVLLWIASKLEENREDDPFDTIASPVAVAGCLLLENHNGEILDGDIDIHHHPLCNPFDVMVRAGDHNLFKVLLSVGNKSVQEKLLKAIFQFGTEENALLFLEKISSDKNQCGFSINDLSPCFYLGWDKAAKSALEILAQDQLWNDLASKRVYHQLLNGFFIQKEIKKMNRNPAKVEIEAQVHRFEQIQKGNFEEIFATLDRMKKFPPEALNFDIIKSNDFKSLFEIGIRKSLIAHFNGKNPQVLLDHIRDS